MKTPERNLNVQSTLQGEKIGMSIDADSLVHIMSIMTDLYSDPEMAVVREYSTNAYDAHVDAGVSLPIEVSLPSELSPYLKIRDYGRGLDAGDIRNIYSLYGASTKRDTNDQIGSLGLGCKSALTYTDQFTLQGIKNGVATQVVISRDENGAGSMTIVAEYATDEASGVEISIPSKKWNSFDKKAKQLFQFWAEGTVLVNGEEPKRFEGFEIADNIFLVGKDELEGFGSQNVIVMGGVPYTFDNSYSNNYQVVAFVEMGEVQFTPNREQLQMTSTTKAVVDRVNKSVSEGKQGAAQRLVSLAKNKPEALDTALRLTTMLNLKENLTFKGKTVPTRFGGNKGDDFHFIVYKPNNHRRYYGRKVSTDTSLPIGMARTAIFFRNYQNKTLGPNPLAKLNHFLEMQGISKRDVENIVLTNELPNATWVDPSRIYDWAQVAAIKLPRQESASGRLAGSYDGFFNGVRETEKAAEDFEDLPTFWFPYECAPNSLVRKTIEDVYGPSNFVELKANRVAKFQRMFPDTRNVSELYAEIAQGWFDALTEDERTFFAIQEISGDLQELDATKVEDPYLKNLIKQAKVSNPTLLAKQESFRYNYRNDIESISLTETYPLFNLDGMYYMSNEDKTTHMEHTYLYLNAVYNSRKDV